MTAANGAESPATRILIVDDEAPARRRLRELLDDIVDEYPAVVVGEAADGREALEILQKLPADLLLLDIHMPDMDGLELARHLLKLPKPPSVVFTTAYQQHAVDAFEVNAVDYLLKPVRAPRLLAALQKVRPLTTRDDDVLARAQTTPRRYLSISERSRVVLVPIEEVIYLKAELKYITVRTAQKEFLLEESLTRLEDEYADVFVRIHRNCLIARAHVKGFERRSDEGDGHWVAVLQGIAEVLDVSRRQQHIVREIGRIMNG